MASILAGKLLVLFALISSCIALTVVEVLDKEKIALPNGNVTLKCKVNYPIGFCSFTFPGSNTQSFLKPGATDMIPKSGFGYYGDGFERGECGIYIARVTEELNGEFTCNVDPPPSELNIVPGKIKLIVAKSPNRPAFSPRILPKYDIGQTLETQCIIKNGRPQPKIVWYLDDMVLVDGLTQPTFTERDNDLIVTQNLTRRITMDDLDRTLKCVAVHITSQSDSNYVSAQIKIQFAPVAREDPILIYGIKIGETSNINVTIQANPKPTSEWTVEGERISENNYDGPPGRLQAIPVTPLGNGYYNATLILSPVERGDTDRKFELRARNSEGERVYYVKITTLEEPEGVGLGVGGIVGIVIAVLFLLITVFLIVFAKATNRWCFGDAVTKRSKPRIAGESSDTESTDAGQHARAKAVKAKPEENPETKESSPMTRSLILPKSFNLRKLLPGGPKNKDKVAQMETGTELSDPKVEEEKPLQSRAEPAELVYAELSLKPTAEQDNRPQPDKTEYAEIVYKNQPIENQMETKDVKKP